MEENNEMYSIEIVKNTIYAVIISSFGSLEEFEELLSKLPEEIQKEILLSIAAAKLVTHAKDKMLKNTLERFIKLENNIQQVFNKTLSRENK